MNGEPAGLQSAGDRPGDGCGLGGGDHQRLPLQERLNALQTHLPGLKGVEGEPEQRRREHQTLDIEDQRHQITDAQPSALQLGAPQAQQHQEADGGNALDQGKEHAAAAGWAKGRIPVVPIGNGEGLLLHLLLAIDLDGTDAREVFLQQIGELGEGFLLTALLAHHPAAEFAHRQKHQRVEGHGRQGEPGIDGHHRRQSEGIGQHRVGETEHGEAKQPPHVLHIAGGPAEHLATRCGLHPGRLLTEQMVKQLLLQIHFHLAAHPKHEHPGQESHRRHDGGQADNPAGLAQHLGIGEAPLQILHHPPDDQGDGDAQTVHHKQGQDTQKQRAAVGPQIAAKQIEPQCTHQGME